MPQIDVVTQHNDNGRTGANLHETVLNTNNVNPQHFGKLFSYPVQGHVYAQPLYASNVTIPNKGIRNVVYIATMHNTVYAFDAEDRNQTATPFWQKQLEDSIPLPDPNIGFPNYRDILREVGILSTPVISRAHAPNAIYVVTASKDPHGNGPGAFSHHLHALDLTTGTDIRPPVQIQATIAGSNGQITFTSNWQNQRPALLHANDTIYIAFASYGDQGPYHGWLLAYSASTLMQISKFNTTLTGGKAGIWQAGQGPAADDAGNLYCFIGNGSFNG